MFRPILLRADYGKLKGADRCRIVGSARPVFAWGASSDTPHARQAACRVRVLADGGALWDSGWIDQPAQELPYGGPALPTSEPLTLAVTVRDQFGAVSETAEERFYVSELDALPMTWITAREDDVAEGHALYFRTGLKLTKKLRAACLYGCGLGYHQFFLNGEPVDDAVMDPAHSDYTQRCYFTMLPGLERYLHVGDNCLSAVIGGGWRGNGGPWLKNIKDGRSILFLGEIELAAALVLIYEDGAREVVGTDGSWQYGYGPIVSNHLFNGETFDASELQPGWNLAGSAPGSFAPVRVTAAPGGKNDVMTLEPIRHQEEYAPIDVYPWGEDGCILDFGQNLAGVCRLTLPPTLAKGQTITIEHAEVLDEDGSLYAAPLRSAACRDTYIARGDGADLRTWQPQFTYHGFRYAHVRGLGLLSKDDIVAVSLYTDVASGSFFRCGSALVNQIQHNIVLTEKANIHSILTDCPQRDERMGWMNDATVRFEETPYNFDIGRLFPKVVFDLMDEQDDAGAITCTAPFVYGGRPADPVCSSFLVAGLESLMHTGNLPLIERAYHSFARWEECLSRMTEGDILPFTRYGDWAAPAYACVDENSARSACTPGEFMSTGYYYYNAVLLRRFAEALGYGEDASRYGRLAEAVRKAMLDKWWNAEDGCVCTGSQACQSFALWLGILPEEGKKKAAERLHAELVEKNYAFTTGNLCSRYMLDVLARYGYVDDAWAILTREEYPSFGYMIQNEATTVWERFELKKHPGMNSHSHPMYGAAGYFLYAYIAGVRPASPGFERVEIQPYFPKGLLSAQAVVDTVKGDVSVRWVRRYGKLRLYVTLPFGMTGTVRFAGQETPVDSGFHYFETELA